MLNSNLAKLGFATILTSSFILASANNSLACVNGCNIFDVSTKALIPSSEGGLAFLEYDYIGQDKNWKGTKSRDEQNNSNRSIDTQVITAGLQYNFNRDWGLTVKAPYVDRKIKVGAPATSDFTYESDRALGDIRLNAHYSGFSSDMSSGIIFGTKLPTGDYKVVEFNRNRSFQFGTGSTDIVLGAYKVGKLSDDGVMEYFVQGAWQKPVMTKKDYRPGDEVNLVVGANHNFGRVGEFSKVAPLIQLVGTTKGKDRGANADQVNSGYSRVMFAPGIELETTKFKFYADVSLPIYTYTEGPNQLVVSEIFKFMVGYKF